MIRFKGISLTNSTGRLLNSEAMSALVTRTEESIVLPQQSIRKDFFAARLFNCELLKTVKFNSKKRWLLPKPNDTMDTRPYGYCDQ